MDIIRHRREAHGIGSMQENLRQIVYGGNDGIVTTFAVVAGFAGAGAEGTAQIGTLAVLLFGLANLFADATAMGLGEFLSSRSQRDIYRATRSGEMARIAEHQQEERDEILTLLRMRDLSDADAAALADQLQKHPELMADFMMSYEFGMANPDDSNPLINGLHTFVSFIFFGIIPLIPYFVSEPNGQTFALSVLATAGALTGLGLVRWRASREALWRCVFETVSVGGVCALVAYAVGWLVGG